MRKSDREIKEYEKIISVLDRCTTIRLGINGGEYPYVVPLSFGYETSEGKLFIYFHCAKEGKKTDLLAADNNVCVEADNLNGYKSTGHGITADYESVIAFGKAREVYGEQAVRGIELLLKHCGVEDYSARECVMLNLAAVYVIEVESITGKKRF